MGRLSKSTESSSHSKKDPAANPAGSFRFSVKNEFDSLVVNWRNPLFDAVHHFLEAPRQHQQQYTGSNTPIADHFKHTNVGFKRQFRIG